MLFALIMSKDGSRQVPPGKKERERKGKGEIISKVTVIHSPHPPSISKISPLRVSLPVRARLLVHCNCINGQW